LTAGAFVACSLVILAAPAAAEVQQPGMLLVALQLSVRSLREEVIT
jgi:hypothetical protein